MRFYNYEGRWGLAYDQAHDAVVAQHALEAHKIPLVGPFSSAGPFQTGGEWYWIIMLGTALYPNSVIAPWIFLTSISVLFVYVIILVSKELIDKKFGLLIGLLATFSTAQITQSTNLTNQTPLAIIALFSIWMMVRYVKLRKSKYLFFLGILVGLAGTIHLQGVLLLLLPFSLFLFNGKPSARSVGILLIGLLIPLIPLLIFDLQSNFINISSMVQYYLHDQYKISLDVLGRRWLTYAGIFWPKTWGHVIGGNMITGYVLIIGVLLIAFYQFLKKKIKKEWYIMLISFLLAVIVLRYTRTPLFESYVVFLHPLILLLTGWLMYVLYSVKKAFGILFIVIVLIGSANKDINEIVNAENYTSFRVNNWKNKLTSQFPGDKFSLYDYKYKTVDMSLPLVLYLNSDKKIFDKGIKIGMVFATKSGEFNFPLIYGEKTGHQILNLNSLTNKELREEGWTLINPSEVYRTTEDWYK
ncbi:MAG: glycosyltransferase family 39 protein [Candidatus Levybacteria bacterium]|nr:glycosyltransferase family 39 protein [Candidatus Levybacteria bacterium]